MEPVTAKGVTPNKTFACNDVTIATGTGGVAAQGECVVGFVAIMSPTNDAIPAAIELPY